MIYFYFSPASGKWHRVKPTGGLSVKYWVLHLHWHGFRTRQEPQKKGGA